MINGPFDLDFVQILRSDSTNDCLVDGRCTSVSGSSELDFGGCALTDADLGDIAPCIDTFGRESITHLVLSNNNLEIIPGVFLEGLDNLQVYISTTTGCSPWRTTFSTASPSKSWSRPETKTWRASLP
ncbi:unnamed protein product [Ectocarpus fasciculatus]